MKNYIEYSSYSYYRFLLISYLFVLTISLSPFMESSHGHNFLFITFVLLFISTNFKNTIYINSFKKSFLYFFIAFFISIILNYNYFRLASFLYTVVLIIMFSTYLNFLKLNFFKLYEYIKTIKIIIFLFFITLLIQQLLYYFDSSFTFNKLGSDGWKMNSLSLEPSLTGIIINILFFSYIKMCDIINNKKSTLFNILHNHFLIFFAYCYIVFTSGSSFGVLFYFIVLLYFTNRKLILISFASLLVLILLLYKYDYTPIVRLFEILPAIKTADVNTIFLTEASAGIRIIPVIIYFNSLNLFDIHTWFGNGSAFSAKQLALLLNSNDDLFYGWAFPSFLIDHGIITFVILIWSIIKYALKSLNIFEYLLFALTLLNTSINTQYFWITVIYFSTNQYFINLYKSDNNYNSNI